MNEAISLQVTTQVPAIPRKYRILPPPDLNEVVEGRFFLEYDYPFLLVREVATRQDVEDEKGNAIAQVEQWKITHHAAGGKVRYDRAGYQFHQPTHCVHGYCHQFIPSASYIDARTWSRLSAADKRKAYKTCVPIVVIELMSETNNIEDLQAKITRFIDAGCREGVIVDTWHDRVWIYNCHQRPYFATFAPIEFEWWPGFSLDCISIRNARLEE